MSILYVPVVVPPQPPSRQAQELAELLSRVVSEYERTHSSITPGEVQQAFMLAQQRSSGAAGARPLILLALGLAVALGIAVMVLLGGPGISREAVLGDSWAAKIKCIYLNFKSVFWGKIREIKRVMNKKIA